MTGRKGLNLMSVLSAQIHDAENPGLSRWLEAVMSQCIAEDIKSISTSSVKC